MSSVNLTGGPNGHIDPEELKCERVSADLFPLLGVQAGAGPHVPAARKISPGRTNFALLSHSLWQRRFGGDPAIAGKPIRLRDQPYTVVGVLPPGFAVLETRRGCLRSPGAESGDAARCRQPLT